MHIKSIEPIAVSLPMLKPVIMAGEEVRRADNVLVRIESDNGVIGWGEAASAPVMTGGDYNGDLRDTEKKKAAGFTAYKIKVGIGTPENDAARTRDICKVLGGGVVISADANQGFSTEQALAYVRAVKGSGLDFFE